MFFSGIIGLHLFLFKNLPEWYITTPRGNCAYIFWQKEKEIGSNNLFYFFLIKHS
jgi:hypothetical protein